MKRTASNIATFFSYRVVGAAAGPLERVVAGQSLWAPSNTSSVQTVTRHLPPSGSLSATAEHTLERSPLPALFVHTEPLKKLACKSICVPTVERSLMPVTCVRTKHHRRFIFKTTCIHMAPVQSSHVPTALSAVQDTICCSSICRLTVKINNCL